jgi:UPF0755 protein
MTTLLHPVFSATPPRRADGRWLLFVGILVVIVAAGFAWRLGTRGEPSRFVVERGASAREIARGLKRQGLIWHRWTFLIWPKLHGRVAVRPGIYLLSPKQTGRSIYETFLHGPPSVRVTIPEGWTAKQIAAVLEAKGVTTADAFLKAVDAHHLEGFLFPDTYFFEQGLSPEQVTQRLVHRFHEKAPIDLPEQEKILHLTEPQIVTLASLVEKEARVPDERPIIAGVFYNRLRKHWRLESCATVEYALGAWKPQLTYKDLDVQSPYNTYRHSGLPPGPICNPGAASLQAASHPAKTDMMFFVAEGGGTHRFSQYYDQHLAAQGVHKRKKP